LENPSQNRNSLYIRKNCVLTVEIPSNAVVLRLAPFFVIPFSILLLVLFFTGYTPQFAAAGAIFASAALLIVDERRRFSISRWFTRLAAGCVSASRQIATIASIIICAGQAMRPGLGLYVVPLAFVANPALLYPGAHLGLAMLAFAKVAIGLWLMSRALIGGKAPAWTAPLFLLVGLVEFHQQYAAIPAEWRMTGAGRVAEVGSGTEVAMFIGKSPL